MISTSQTREEEFTGVRHGIRNLAAEVGEIRTSIQHQTNILEVSTSNITSTLEKVESLQRSQQQHLPELKDRIDTLQDMIENLLDRKSNELPLCSHVTKSQRIEAMQSPVSGIISEFFNANFGQGPISSEKADRKAESCAGCS